MKVTKRDGRVVDYDRNKIIVAIQKANAEVDRYEQVSEEKIDAIVAGIENKHVDNLQVEDIQDMIEQKLMSEHKYALAKKYIIYRYTREMVRRANTTDDSIMSLIQNSNKDVMEENSNKNAYIASTQRDLIAGEVSKDLTKRVLLPEKIVKAHEDGVLHFHDMDYYLQSIFNCCLINIGDMFEHGTVMNGKLIESPKSFQVACTVMTQIISAVASSQYGGQSVDVRHLGKYLRMTREKYERHYEEKYGDKVPAEVRKAFADDRIADELRSGVQTIQYQINTLMTTNGQSPFVTLFLNLDKDDPYIEENAMIKAEAIAKLTDAIVLADDSGLEIDYLNKEPGIYSARYAGTDTSYEIKNNLLLQRLEGVPDEKRTARFVCAIAAVFPDGSKETVRGTIEGRIGYEIAGEHGFGYDPIFYLPEYGCTTAELDPEKKNELSHRGKALRLMRGIIEQKMQQED